jgi:hypothetical protein
MRSGTGTVIGPDSVAAGWQVARFTELLPQRERSFEEARDMVEHAWSQQEGERRMVELLRGLRKRTQVIVNDNALARLVREGLGVPEPNGSRISGTGS